MAVATRDRPRRLAGLLAGLRAQTLDPAAFEVVVADDGSEAETASVLAAERERGVLRLTVVRHDAPRGPGAARNAAWRAGAGGLVAFTDDDCVPAPGWLAGGWEAHRGDPAAVVQGRTEPDPRERDRDGVFSRTMRVESPTPQWETCNVFYPRALLERLGGFDEGFGLRPGGEDTDLAWRARAAGAAGVFAPAAIVHHAVEPLGPVGALREAARWTESMRVYAEHPEARAGLVRGVFWSVWHYLLLRSALALALPRPLRRFLLARHFLALRRRARRQGAGTWAVPFLLVRDAVEMWGVVRGAVRYRTLVL